MTFKRESIKILLHICDTLWLPKKHFMYLYINEWSLVVSLYSISGMIFPAIFMFTWFSLAPIITTYTAFAIICTPLHLKIQITITDGITVTFWFHFLPNPQIFFFFSYSERTPLYYLPMQQLSRKQHILGEKDDSLLLLINYRRQ